MQGNWAGHVDLLIQFLTNDREPLHSVSSSQQMRLGGLSLKSQG